MVAAAGLLRTGDRKGPAGISGDCSDERCYDGLNGRSEGTHAARSRRQRARAVWGARRRGSVRPRSCPEGRA
eukprot:8614174-Alexandrium_andersonii.AAC.1